MGKASKWFRQLIGLKKSDPFPPTQNPVPKHPPKRKWSFSKPSSKQQPTHPSPAPPDDEMHAAAVADAVVVAAHAAAEAVRLTKTNRNKLAHVSSGGAHVSLGSREERAAAVMIQKHFRGYLSRRALRALKGLVKLQALVRGRIARKEQIERLQKMQAISRVQTRARALRAQIFYESSHSNNVKSSQLHHLGPATPEKSEHAIRKHVVHEQSYMLKRNGSRTNARVVPDKEKARLNYNRDEDSWDHSVYSSKTGLLDDGKSNRSYEIDTGKPFVSSKRRTLFQSSVYPSASDPNSHSFTTSKDSTIHQTIRSPSSCEIESFNPITFTDDIDEPLFCTAENSPFCSVSKGNTSTRGPFTPTRSDASRSCLSGYSDVPNYMSYTESSRAKVRSLSAPRQRTQLERSSTAKRFSINGGYGDLRSSSTQRGSSTLQANFTNKAYPGSDRLDRLGLPVGGGDGVGFSGGLWHKY